MWADVDEVYQKKRSSHVRRLPVGILINLKSLSLEVWMEALEYFVINITAYGSK